MTTGRLTVILMAVCTIAIGLAPPQRAYSAPHIARLHATELSRAGIVERGKDFLVLGPGAVIPTNEGAFILTGSDRCPPTGRGVESEQCTVIASGTSEHVVHLAPAAEETTLIHTAYNSKGLLIFWGDVNPNDLTTKIAVSFLGGLWDAQSEVITQQDKLNRK